MAAPKRIDKEHGFMKIIIKNQVDRDRYNKEVEEEKRNQYLPPKIQLAESASTKPSTPVYKPHTQEGGQSGANAKINDCIFKLEYEDDKGIVHVVMVTKSENAHSVAKRMASQSNLPNHLIEALEIRLRKEFNRKKRQSNK